MMHGLLVPVGVAAVAVAVDEVGELDTRVNCGVEAAFLVSAELLGASWPRSAPEVVENHPSLGLEGGLPLEFRPSFHDDITLND